MAQGWVDAGQHTLPGLFDERLDADPDGPFLDCCGTMYTAAMIEDAANRLASALASLGVGHGSTIATILENGSAAVLSWFAAQRLGAIYVPVNTALKGSLLRHQLADASTMVVIVQEDLLSRPAEILDSIYSVEHLVVGSPTQVPVRKAPVLKATVHSWDELLTAAPVRPDVRVRACASSGDDRKTTKHPRQNGRRRLSQVACLLTSMNHECLKGRS
jgi:crotonobetaine/carnitine-CoA ligase